MRIQLELSDNTVAQIKELMKEANIKTYSDVFSNALSVLLWASKAARKGKIIVTADEDTKEMDSQLAMPLLDAVRPAQRPGKREEEKQPEPLISKSKVGS